MSDKAETKTATEAEATVKKNTGAGLRGQSAGETEISTVGVAGNNLRYRGYNVQDLAAQASFYEVAYLILRGRLPTQTELDRWTKRIKGYRGLPQPMKDVLERIPGDAHPMDVMRTTVSFMGNIEPEGDFSNQLRVTERLMMMLPSALLYWYRYSHDDVRIETQTDDDGIGAHFLHLLHGEAPDELAAKVMDVSLILYAEHEFNASTFTARLHHRGDRLPARPAAWRRQRGGDGDDRTVRLTRGSRGRRQAHAGGEEVDHGLRTRGLPCARPA